MSRVARLLGPGRARVLGGLGGLLACGAAGVAVAASPKPADAPLRPPVDPAAPLDAQARATASASPGAGLVISATPVCGAAATAVDPSLRQVLQQLRAATTGAERQTILQQLTPDQRQQITALQRGQSRAGSNGERRCNPGTATANPDAQATPAPMIEPQVVDGSAAAAPDTSSYVS